MKFGQDFLDTQNQIGFILSGYDLSGDSAPVLLEGRNQIRIFGGSGSGQSEPKSVAPVNTRRTLLQIK